VGDPAPTLKPLEEPMFFPLETAIYNIYNSGAADFATNESLRVNLERAKIRQAELLAFLKPGCDPFYFHILASELSYAHIYNVILNERERENPYPIPEE
jgi:hypothetical protein